jgi:hypothetical protein
VPVPADAAMVMHIDGKSLSSKFAWDDFKKGEFYRVISAQEELDSMARQILDNPENSGIDIKSDVFFFSKRHGTGGFYAFVLPLKDEKAFAAMIKDLMKEEAPVKEGGLNIIKRGSNVLTWNSSRAVAVMDNPGMGKMSPLSKNYGGTQFEADSLLKFAKEIYDMKESNSIANNDKFNNLLKETGDLHIWMNTEEAYRDVFAALPLSNASDLFKGSVGTFTVNFDNGKITADAKSYMNEKMRAIYEKNKMQNISEDMLKKIPSQNVSAVFAMNYPPAALKDILTMIGADGMANMFLSDMGYTLDDFLKALKGDLVIAVSDAGVPAPPTVSPEAPDAYYQSKPTAKVLVATSVKDQASFEKVLAMVHETMGKSGASAEALNKVFPHQVKDGWFIGSTDSALVNSFGKTNIDHPFIRRISGHPIGGYINLQGLINGFKPMIGRDYMGGAVMDESISMWQDIIFYGGEIKDGVMTGHAEINLVDKTTSSLKQLNDYFGRIAKHQEESKAKMRDLMSMDSTSTLLSDSVIIDRNKIKVKEIEVK